MFSGLFNKLLGRKEAATRDIAVKKAVFVAREDDTFIVSYPKSGNTWARFLIGNYITGNNFDFLNANDFIPDMHASPGKCEAIQGKRIVKSHLGYQPGYNNVIYICRNPLDVAVSFYYYYLKYHYSNIAEKPTFETFLDQFIAGKVEFGRWDEHVNSWLDHKPARFLLVRYEDMVENAEQALREMLVFIFGTVDEERLKKAAEASRFERMAELEQQQKMKHPRHAASDTSIPFVRKGKVGGFKEHFSEEREKAFVEKFAAMMRRLGYADKTGL